MQMSRRKYERGFTLVEIIVVVVILALLSSFLFGKIFSAGADAKIKLNTMKMESLKGMINQYRFVNNKLPQSIADLTRCPPSAGSQCVPVAKDEDVRDAWDGQFEYALKPGGRSYTITSFGADGAPGGSGEEGDASIEGP